MKDRPLNIQPFSTMMNALLSGTLWLFRSVLDRELNRQTDGWNRCFQKNISTSFALDKNRKISQRCHLWAPLGPTELKAWTKDEPYISWKFTTCLRVWLVGKNAILPNCMEAWHIWRQIWFDSLCIEADLDGWCLTEIWICMIQT